MRLSTYFLPTLKENPAEAQIVSHRLMLRAGMVRQSAAGIYTWLPLGFRVLQNIEQIVREEQDRAGAQEVLMPTLQPAELWKESGRYEDYGKEMLRIRDRHERDMLYGPTNEEMITAIVRETVKSYKELPKILYHVQWKFRDEVRPRFGVMRGREFLMKDGYSFDIDRKAAENSYWLMFDAYMKTFNRMGLKAVPLRADTGPIGGDLSHEFHILADTGESAVFVDKDFLEIDWASKSFSAENDFKDLIDLVGDRYAVTEEKRDEAREKELGDKVLAARGIEVGQIFYFGKKYTESMGVRVPGPNGETIIPECGSYGIGVSRLVGGIIEASHDDAGIIWPEPVAPFKLGLINLKVGDSACDAACAMLYRAAGGNALYDDRDERAGAKFANMDLIGLPWQVIVGPRGAAQGQVEVKNRRTGERVEMSVEAAAQRFGG